MTWERPPERLDLSTDEVHVWRFGLRPRRTALGPLSDAERRRADRFRSPLQRDRYLTSRSIVRSILGRYLNLTPADVPIAVRPSGKPYLRTTDLQFNLSHSGGMAVLALARTHPVGIDLERARRTLAYQQLAERFFSDREIAALRMTPRSIRAAAFFRIWTRKEAYLKATDIEIGSGLPTSLARFTVAGLPANTTSSVDVPDHPDESERWALIDLDVAPGHFAALAVEGHPRIRMFDAGAARR